MIVEDTRAPASPITDYQNELLNHLSRIGSVEYRCLVDSVELVYLVLASDGIVVGIMEIAVALDQERRFHRNVFDTRDAVLRNLRERLP